MKSIVFTRNLASSQCNSISQLERNDIDEEDDLGKSTEISSNITEEVNNAEPSTAKEISELLKNVPCKTIKLTIDVKMLTKAELQSIATSTNGNK